MIEYSEAFDWMADECIIDLYKKATDPQARLHMRKDNDAFRCRMSDTGLLAVAALANRSVIDERMHQDVAG